MPPLNLLQLYQESLEFRGVSIWIDNRRRQQIRRRLRSSTFTFGNSQEAPVDRHADLVELFAVHHHGLDALGHHRFGDVIGASAGHLHLLTSKRREEPPPP